MNTTKRTVGFYLGAVAAVLGIVSIVLNNGVPNSIGPVTMMLIAAVVIEVIFLVLPLATGARPVYNLVSIVTSALFAAALTYSFGPQMNQLGNVVAGLDDPSSLQSFFLFVGVAAAGLLVDIVSSFTGRAESC